MNRDATSIGTALALLSAFLWSFFPLLTFGDQALPPFTYAGASTLVAAALFAGLLTAKGRWRTFSIAHCWVDLAYLTLLNGVIFHAGVFFAARTTPPGTVIMLLQLELPFSVLMLRLLGKEQLRPHELFGCVTLFLGAIVLVLPRGTSFRLELPELVLIGCAALPPLGNLAVRRARLLLTTVEILFVRSLVAGAILLTAGLSRESPPALNSLSALTLAAIAANGIFIMALGKLIWVEAVTRIPISKAVALGATTPAITLLLTYLFFGTLPTMSEWGALVLVTAGVLLITQRRATTEG